MMEHPYGWLSLLPPLVAIVLAIATRRIVLSLIVGIFAGAMLMASGNPITAVYHTWETHLWNTLVDSGKLRVFSFTLFMGAMIGVITRSGGMQGLIQLVSPYANNRKRGQLATWILGILIFFDDYANTILLGSTLRPICDRLKISREKLAYLVDSTAAPVAAIAPISTWVAVEIEYIASGLEGVSADGLTGFGLFIASIPYRFYVWTALFLIPITALLGRDFGPMLSAERKAQQESNDGEDETSAEQGVAPAGWYLAVGPIAITLAFVLYFIYTTGVDSVGSDASLRDIFGAADSTMALQYGALAGLIVAAISSLTTRVLNVDEVMTGAVAGAKVVLPAIAILWTASAMSKMTTNKAFDGRESDSAYAFKDHRLYTADYLTQVFAKQQTEDANGGTQSTGSTLSAQWLPTVVFVLAAVVAFCTGTSWGTMGILVPMVVQTALAILTQDGATVSSSDPILLSSVGGVLAGAVFGDHCSPISDTTVLSSQSCACDHLAHVWTQMPYAVLAAAIAILLGTIPIGFGISIWLLLPAQILALVVFMRLVGRKP